MLPPAATLNPSSSPHSSVTSSLRYIEQATTNVPVSKAYSRTAG
jgi:hypothetical protein